MGIGVYNEECRKIVLRYAREWEQTITRSGRWIDFKNDYKTLDLNFMVFFEESPFFVFEFLYCRKVCGGFSRHFMIRIW
jgi:isoleucyl-tRNA synthetase